MATTAKQFKEYRLHTALQRAQTTIDARGGLVDLTLDEAEGGEQFVSIAPRHQTQTTAHQAGVMTLDHERGVWVLYRPNHRITPQIVPLDADPLRSIQMLPRYLAPRPQQNVFQRVAAVLAA